MRKTLLLLTMALPSIVCAQVVNQAPDKPYEPHGAGFKIAAQCGPHHVFASRSLGRQMGYCIILPTDYRVTTRRYPVLYLLHGLFGSENDWLALTKVADYVATYPLIVVMPEGDDGWYTNSVMYPANRYEDYVVKDVVQEIESNYRVDARREARFIAGLSMGGYGAMKFALKYPQMFAAAGGFSSALAVARSGVSEFKTPGMAFGPENGKGWHDNDVFMMMGRSNPAELPYMFESCGTMDPLLWGSREMMNMMYSLRVTYEYHEILGRHEWPVWDRSVKMFLDALAERGFIVARVK